MSVTTFGSSNTNPFVINTWGGGATVNNTNNSGNTSPLNAPTTPPVIAAPGTPPAANVLYANGVLVNAVHTLNFNGMTKQVAECTANGKKLWVDLSAFSPELVPQKIAENLTQPSTVFSGFILPNNLALGKPNSAPDLPFNWDSTALIMKEKDSNDWYGYTLYPNPTYDTNLPIEQFMHNDTVVSAPAGLGPGGIVVPPMGRNRLGLSGKLGTVTIPGTHITQHFTSQASANSFAALYPGAAITNNSITNMYPNNPVSQADLQALLNQGWVINNTIFKDVPGLVNILQGSQQYNDAIAQGYSWVQTGTKKVLVKNGTPATNFDDITESALNTLKAQYPNLQWHTDGYFTSTSTETYPDMGILENSDLFNKLKSEGWTLTPTGEFDIKTIKQIIDTKKDLTLDEVKALGDAWKYVANGKTKTVTTQVGTSKTVSLTGLTDEQIKQYASKPGYKIVKENMVSHPTDPVVEQWKVDNKTGGLWGAEGIDVGDGSGTLTAAGLNASYDKSTYKVGSLFAKPAGLNPNDMFVDKDTAIDKKDSFMFAGDPKAWDMGGFEGGPLDDANYVDIHPDADIYNVVNGGNKKFSFSVNQAIEPINNEGNVAARMYGYAFNFDGEEFKLAVKDGQATLTKPDGTTQVVDPKVGLKLPVGANPALVEISEATIAGAGYNGASEKRLNIRFAELASDDVVADLKAKGFSDAEIFEKTTNWNTIHHGFRIPESDADGAYTPDSSGTAVATPEASNGVKTYYDTHWLVEKPDKTFTKTTTGTTCDKTYDIEYTETCNETKTEEVPLYDATLEKDCEVKTPKYKATKQTEVKETKYDACNPATPDEYKDVPEGKFQEKCYELKKTTDCWTVDVDTPSKNVDCWHVTQTGSPLALDLNRNNELTDSKSKEFDLDGDGTTEKYNAWFEDGDAVLAFDTNKDGKINNGGELFGNYSNFIQNQSGFGNGYDALRAFANQVNTSIVDDGKIDAAELAQLENAGLVASVGNQVKKLSELGVTELSLNAQKESYAEASGALLDPVSSAKVNGNDVLFADAWFTPEASSATSDDGLSVTSDNADDSTTTVSDKPARPQDPLPWERNNYANPWLYNNSPYGAPLSLSTAPNFGLDPLMMQMMSAMGGFMPSAYGYQQQQQVQMQQQVQQVMMNFYLQALIASLMPQFSSQQYQVPVSQQQSAAQQQYNPFNFY